LGLSEEDLLVGSIRHARPLYRIETLVKGFLAWVNSGALAAGKAKLLILAGSSDRTYLSELHALIETSGKKSIIYLVEGFIGQDELLGYYSAIDIPISIAESDRLGAPVLEVLGLGKVPILNDLPSYRELLHDFDISYVRSNPKPQDVAAALNKYIDLFDPHDVNAKNASLSRRFSFNTLSVEFIENLEHFLRQFDRK